MVKLKILCLGCAKYAFYQVFFEECENDPRAEIPNLGEVPPGGGE